MKVTVSELRKIIRESLSQKFLDLLSENKENMEITDIPAGKAQRHTIGDGFERVDTFQALNDIGAPDQAAWEKWSAYQSASMAFEKQTGILLDQYEISDAKVDSSEKYEKIAKQEIKPGTPEKEVVESDYTITNTVVKKSFLSVQKLRKDHPDKAAEISALVDKLKKVGLKALDDGDLVIPTIAHSSFALEKQVAEQTTKITVSELRKIIREVLEETKYEPIDLDDLHLEEEMDEYGRPTDHDKIDEKEGKGERSVKLGADDNPKVTKMDFLPTNVLKKIAKEKGSKK